MITRPATRRCPVCGAGPESARLFLEENIDPARVTRFSYASRKAPEYMCHRLQQCSKCDLVYVDRPPAEGELALAYHEAAYDSAEEAKDAAAAYVLAAKETFARLPSRTSVLEIGTGTGIFLDLLQEAGFTQLTGVEPSRAAINAAAPHRKAWIREGMFKEGDFAPESFDLICCFMTMEHVSDPMAIMQAAQRLLRPGGAFVTVTHDYRSKVNRLLGKRSPIIDIEHMQLFSRASIQRLFEETGLEDVSVRPFVNRYAIEYWLRLTPLPAVPKRWIASMLEVTGVGRIKLGFNVGNLFSAGFKLE